MKQFAKDLVPYFLAAVVIGLAMGMLSAVVEFSRHANFSIGFACGAVLFHPLASVFQGWITPRSRPTHDDI
jgi:hypothetical protein